jgi:hypothetical protein
VPFGLKDCENGGVVVSLLEHVSYNHRIIRDY